MPRYTDEARRQGQFEGQVLTTLSDIKSKIENIDKNYGGLDNRVRNLESQTLTLGETVTNAMKKGDETIQESVDDRKQLNDRVKKLEEWRIWIMAIAATIAALTELTLRLFFDNK